MAVSAESVSVPGKARCSFDLPTVWTGRTSTSSSVRNERHHAGEIALVDEGVDADRQVRTVLLDRRRRQHRDGAAHVAGAELLRRQVEPEAGGHRSVLGSRRAIARPPWRRSISTSTLNSGRAKPDTIIRVEAGGGAAT